MIRRRTRLQAEKVNESSKCSKHDEKEILFCDEARCQKVICAECLSEAHLGHKVVSIKDDTKDILAKLVQNIQFSQERLNKKITKVEDVSQDVLKKTEANIMQIKAKKEKMIRDLEKKKEEMKQDDHEKEEMMKQYDEMMKQAEDEERKLREVSANELTAMRDNVEFLNNIKVSIEAEENTYEDALNKLDTVTCVERNVEHLPRVKTYEYSEYLPGQQNLVGTLIKKEKTVYSASKLQGQVRQSFDTGFGGFLFGMTVLSDCTVVVCGEKGNHYKLVRYSLESGRELSSTDVNLACGMAEVELGGTSTLAVSDYTAKKIEFRNKEDVNEILLTISVDPHQPELMCAVSPSVLVYKDTSTRPVQLHWLDCSGAKPKLLGITANASINGVQDMCVVQSENEKLLIVISRDKNEILAYNCSTGELQCSIEKKIPGGSFVSFGVAGDGDDYLFDTDYINNCIHMFSLSDGQYLGCLLKHGDQGLEYPRRLRWSETSSSLVVEHFKDTKWFIGDIH